jgi:DNA-binding CsgD family transcriptional regulator
MSSILFRMKKAKLCSTVKNGSAIRKMSSETFQAMPRNKKIFYEIFLDAFSEQSWKGMMNFIFDKMPSGIIVFDRKNRIIFSNRYGRLFLRRHELPKDVAVFNKKIFDSICTGRLEDSFPGEIYLKTRLNRSAEKWTFKFEVCERPEPFVCVFISGESIAGKIRFNELRKNYGLARREIDVLRRILAGLKQKEICEELELSPEIVKDHIGSLHIKFGVSNRQKLVSVIESLAEKQK